MIARAVHRTECQCDVCQSYCRHVPGWFLPGEMELAAKLLRLTPAMFFKKHVTVDYVVGNRPVFALRPRTVKESGGLEAAYDPRGSCAFYVDGKCKIHKAKPYECATAHHEMEPPKGWHQKTASAWRRKAAQLSIRKLLGRKAEQAEPSFADLIGLAFAGFGF